MEIGSISKNRSNCSYAKQIYSLVNKSSHENIYTNVFTGKQKQSQKTNIFTGKQKQSQKTNIFTGKQKQSQKTNIFTGKQKQS